MAKKIFHVILCLANIGSLIICFLNIQLYCFRRSKDKPREPVKDKTSGGNKVAGSNNSNLPGVAAAIGDGHGGGGVDLENLPADQAARGQQPNSGNLGDFSVYLKALKKGKYNPPQYKAYTRHHYYPGGAVMFGRGASRARVWMARDDAATAPADDPDEDSSEVNMSD